MTVASLSIGSASWPEIAWTIIAVAGALFCCLNTYNAWIDQNVSETIHAGNGRLAFARFTVKVELSRLIVQIIFVAIGVVAMSINEPPPDIRLPEAIRVEGYLLEYGLLASAVLLMLSSYLIFQRRRAVLSEVGQ